MTNSTTTTAINDTKIQKTTSEIYKQITSKMPNSKVRHSQMEMIAIIDKCFSNINPKQEDGHNICILEAPTGTGKSLAYLLSGVVNAKKLNKKLVISTATKALQLQLLEKDIPDFIAHSGIDFTYGLANGRSNYLCPYKLELSLSIDHSSDMLSELDHTQESLLRVDKLFANKKWDGNLNDCPVNISKTIRPMITMDKDGCLSTACVYNQKDNGQKDNITCPYFKMRNQLKYCDVIVTNHSLLLSDITLGGGVVLPTTPKDYLLCLDEGHTFTDIAIDSFSSHFLIKQTIEHCKNLAKFIYNPDVKLYISDLDINVADDIHTQTLGLVDELDKLLLLISRNINLFNEDRLIINDYLNVEMAIFKDHFVNLLFIAGDILEKLKKIDTKWREKLKNGNDYIIENNLNAIGYYIGNCETIVSTSECIINTDDGRYNANAKWIEIHKHNNDIDFMVRSSLTHVGNLLFNKLFTKVYGAIIVSATLSVNNNFTYYMHKLGLHLYDNTINHRLPASFNYTQQSQIIVPKFKYAPEYKTRNEFNCELAEYLNTKALNYKDGYGTLVLFFNKTQMLDIYNQIDKQIQSNILMQTDFVSTQKLISIHKNNIDNGVPSIIFGLNSFSEGVDLPGLYCMHVIITKLPFDVHKNPLNLVQEYWCNFEKMSYFKEVSIPETCIRLIQATGRLLRGEEDYGQITICDGRIIEKNYGAFLLNALPDFNRNYNKNFLEEHYKILKNL